MWKSKTVYAGLAGIVSSFGLFMSSEISLAEFLQVAVPSLLAIFLRAGVQKSTDAAEAAVEAASSVTPAKKKSAKAAN
jgi:hypothetical protein